MVRIAIGLAATLAVIRLWALGWLETLYAPAHRLAYPGLGWIPSLDYDGLRILGLVVVAAGIATVLGVRTRLAAATLALAFTWLELIEATTYLNHYWFISSMAALLAVVPAGAEWSLDACRRGRHTVPTWAIWAVRAQVGVVYLFAGVAKLSSDWLIEGLPLRLWLPARSDLPVIGSLLAQPGTAMVASWAGAIFDLGVVWFLLHRRTRPWAWAAVVIFHLATWVLFPSIGIFPWVMIVVSTVFFSPDWPRRLVGRPRSSAPAAKTPRRWAVATAFLLIVQVALPLRHLANPANPAWTGEGFRFAWNVLAVERTGHLRFVITDSLGEESTVDPALWFSPNQMRILPTDPQLILEAAHVLSDELGGAVEVRADSWLSINGRAEATLMNPDVDLAQLVLGAEPTWYLVQERDGPGTLALQRYEQGESG